jgi:hypothetical protein
MSPSVVTPGQSATLTWSSQHATACNGSGSWSGAQAMSGSITVQLLAGATQTYTLYCAGDGRAAESTVTLAPEPEAGSCTVAGAVRAHSGKRTAHRRKTAGSAM